MLDFLMISTRSTKRGVIEIYPKFIIKKSSDLMIRGGDFYAIWVEERGLWSTDEQDALSIIDKYLDKYAEENNIKLSKEDKRCTSVLHGIIGADIVKKKYEYTDEMCRAIYYHTTGITNMTLLAKIVYIADKIEDSRNYEEADKLREKFKECKTRLSPFLSEEERENLLKVMLKDVTDTLRKYTDKIIIISADEDV